MLQTLIEKMKVNSFTLRKDNPPQKKNRWYPAKNIRDEDYADISAQIESQYNSLEQVARGFGFYRRSDKTEFMSLKKKMVPYLH